MSSFFETCCGAREGQAQRDDRAMLNDLVKASNERKQIVTSPPRTKTKIDTLLQKMGKAACCCSQESSEDLAQRLQQGKTPMQMDKALREESALEGADIRVPAAVQAEKQGPMPDIKGPSVPRPPGGPPQLDGEFLLSEVQGDMDAFLTDMGIGWALRSLASTAGYGIGSERLRISQDGQKLSLQYIGMRPYTQTFEIGAGSQDCTGPSGPVVLTPLWDGGAVRIAVNQGGEDKAVRWLYLQNGVLTNHAVTVQGNTARHVYKPAPA
eukprot:gb/GFBE01009061.1/.p1 GENE.gb/GFBE01009061.1/~~gb/GFBE01009061.1/.p1  ORF type:complete len:267 (+),score=56.54 gb/GFBE01009061.1/:1-801(+)